MFVVISYSTISCEMECFPIRGGLPPKPGPVGASYESISYSSKPNRTPLHRQMDILKAIKLAISYDVCYKHELRLVTLTVSPGSQLI